MMFGFKFSSFVFGLCAVSASVLANSCEDAEIDVHNLTTVALELMECNIEGMPEASTIAPDEIIKRGDVMTMHYSLYENKGMPVKGDVTFLGVSSDNTYIPGGLVKLKYNYQGKLTKNCGRVINVVSVKSDRVKSDGFKTFVVPHYNGVTDVYVTEDIL